MKKIFLTGGNGFIGKNIVKQLGEAYTIYAPSREELDLLDAEAVEAYLKSTPVDIVVHTANIGGKRNQSTPDAMQKKNMLMFEHIIAAKPYFSRMIMLGSGAEYDKRDAIVLAKEKDAEVAAPVDAYGVYKKTCSDIARDVDFITHLRLFGVFGPHEDYRVRFISNNICRALFDLPISLRKNVAFDYLYIDDFINILRWFLEQEHTQYKHYNVCTGTPIDLVSLAHIIKDVSSKDIEIQVGEEGMGKEYSGDNARLMAEMGAFQYTPIEESVEELYEWYEERKGKIDRKELLFDKA